MPKSLIRIIGHVYASQNVQILWGALRHCNGQSWVQIYSLHVFRQKLSVSYLINAC